MVTESTSKSRILSLIWLFFVAPPARTFVWPPTVQERAVILRTTKEVVQRRPLKPLHAVQQNKPSLRKRVYTTSKDKRLATLSQKKRNPSASHSGNVPKSIQAPGLFQAFNPRENPLDEDQRRDALSIICNRRILTSILNSWARSRELDAAERCHGVLKYLQAHGEEIPSLGPPNEFLYSVVINAYARRQRAEQAEGVLREMMLANNGPEPNVIVFSSVMNAWSKCTDVADAPDQCRYLLREMLQRRMEPNLYSYNILMDAYASQGRAREAQELLEEMLTEADECGKIPIPRPDQVTFHSVLNAWSKSRDEDAPDRCNELVEMMTNECYISPDKVTYGILIGAYSNRGRAREAEQVLRTMKVAPDVVTYSTVINAWCKSVDPDAPDHCRRLLEEMKELSSGSPGSQGHEAHRLTPNIITYATVMDAFASRGRPHETEELLTQVLDSPDLTPNILCYNVVLNAWAKSDATDAPDKCRQWLAHMWEQCSANGANSTNDDLQPTVISYNTVLDALAVRGRAQEAHALLQEMLGKPSESNNGHPRPDRVSFHSVLHAWSKSEDRTAPDKCLELMKEMQRDSHTAPTDKTVTSVVKTFSKHGRTREATEISQAWSEKRKNGGRRNLRPSTAASA